MKKPSTETDNPLTVLVLDDAETWRNLVKSVLERELGIAPVVASSGEEALEILHSRPIDVVVSDLNMPEMSGIQFMQRAKLVSPKTKVVIMTADLVTRILSEACMALGAFGVVFKGEIEPKLVKLLRELK